jgi:hypothetical protein
MSRPSLKGKMMKSAATLLVALLFGVALGALLAHPPKVKAVGTVYVDKVTDGPNAIAGGEVVGFACKQTDCYIASR